MEFSYKFRLYPNREQENQILRTFGCCRYVFNHYLALRKDTYKQTGETLNYYACAKDLTVLKQQEETLWLRDVDATALQSSLRDLDDAYQNFFRRVQRGESPGYPHFKSKRFHKQSYKSKCVGSNIKVLEGAVQLPKLGKVKCRITRTVQGRILSATVSKTASGKYYVSLCCRLEQELPKLPLTGAVVGLDVGIKSFAVSSFQRLQNSAIFIIFPLAISCYVLLIVNITYCYFHFPGQQQSLSRAHPDNPGKGD